VAQGNDWLGVEITVTIDRPVEAWWAPIETVSNSEGGVERTYQGSAVLLSEVVTLEPGGRWSLAVRQDVAIRRDLGERGLAISGSRSASGRPPAAP
jgi:hypothetical protein